MARAELYARTAARGELSPADQRVVAYMLDALREHRHIAAALDLPIPATLDALLNA